jgi:hypothetical protein
MEKIIKIENKRDQRILISYSIYNSKVDFDGEYKPHNEDWIRIESVSYPINTFNEKLTIEDVMEKIIEAMKDKIINYERFKTLMNGINVIEYKEDL